MADWTSAGGPGAGNIAVARRTLQMLMDPTAKNGAILNHPFIRDLMARDAALGQLIGELGVSVNLVTIGTGKMAATAEATAATATAWTAANSTTVTPARRAYARKVTDFAVSLQQALLGPSLPPTIVAALVMEAVATWLNDVIDRLLATCTTATYTIGTTATALSWGAVHEGVIDIRDRGAMVDFALGLLTAKGAKDLLADSLSLGGAIQWAPQSQQAIQDVQRGAYLGKFFGVDFFLNSECDTDGGDTVGGLFTPGSHLMKTQKVPLPSGAIGVADLPGMLTVEYRRADGGVSYYEYVSYNALAVLEQTRFAQIRYVT